MPCPTRLTTLVLVLLLAVLRPAPASALTDAEVESAIEKMQAWLAARQDKQTGAWKTDTKFPGPDQQAHGETAIAVQALLASGRSPQDPQLDKALKYLREAEMNGTYAIGVRCHVWAALPDEYLSNLEQDAAWLIKAQNGGIWDYGPKRTNRIDNSTTQYGLLGLWEYSKRGGRIPEKVLSDVAEHFVKTQQPDGGWHYGPGRPTSGSMTAAGLTVLYVTLQEAHRGKDTPPEQIMASIDKGLAWLDKNFKANTNPGRGNDLAYYLYGIERVALASGIKTFGGQDWFEAGATELIRKMGKSGNDAGSLNDHGGRVANTAFALMFLSRGRVPVWITKLQVPGSRTNNRPNDIYFLTRYLSDLREAELNWQTVPIDLDVAQWSNTPVAWISSDQPLKLNDTQIANLKKYIDGGGVLIANAENNSAAFVQSVKQIAQTMYPDQTVEQLPDDHPAFQMIYQPAPAVKQTMLGMNNGARDLVIIVTRDFGKQLQADQKPGGSDPWKVMNNLYYALTDRGTLSNRLAQAIPTRNASRSKKGDIRVARAKYDGDWDLEAAAWDPFKVEFFNKTGFDLVTSEVALDDLASSDAVLVHLAGAKPITLTESQKQAIKAFVGKGGTVLIETIGGSSEFSVKLEEQLKPLFDAPAAPLAAFEPIITGDGLTDGYNARRVLYRPYSVITLAARTTPRLAAYIAHNRPAVLISHEDLSLGALGMRRWGINGYQPESARQLLTNVILAAKKAKGS